MSIKLGTQAITIPYKKAYLGSQKVFEKNTGPVYTPTDYIDDPGLTSYYDTGVVLKPTTKIELEALYSSSGGTIFGVKGTSGEPTLTISFAARRNLTCNMGDAGTANTLSSMTNSTETLIEVSNTEIKATIYSDPVLIKQTTPKSTITTTGTLNMYMFGYNYDGEPATSQSARIYSCKIYEGSTLVRDYQPALDANNIPCFYEAVNNVLVYATST